MQATRQKVTVESSRRASASVRFVTKIFTCPTTVGGIGILALAAPSRSANYHPTKFLQSCLKTLRGAIINYVTRSFTLFFSKLKAQESWLKLVQLQDCMFFWLHFNLFLKSCHMIFECSHNLINKSCESLNKISLIKSKLSFKWRHRHHDQYRGISSTGELYCR